MRIGVAQPREGSTDFQDLKWAYKKNGYRLLVGPVVMGQGLMVLN